MSGPYHPPDNGDNSQGLSHVFPNNYDLSRLQGPQQYSDGISFWDYTNPPLAMAGGQDAGSGNGRQRVRHGPDHVKHRRTRSGCYTCRSRRVKVCNKNMNFHSFNCRSSACADIPVPSSAMKQDPSAIVCEDAQVDELQI